MKYQITKVVTIAAIHPTDTLNLKYQAQGSAML